MPQTDSSAQSFLLPHHLAAADRLERLIERARLLQRVTMSYDATRVGGSRGQANAAVDLSDTATGARQALNRLANSLPSDCWGVLFDTYGMAKGLQAIETERRWPRRSAKLVLRIGLEQLADQFGLRPHGQGHASGTATGWLEHRLPLIAESASAKEP